MSLRSDLLCRNGCGFFGNPEWQWFCSKCWRQHLQHDRQKSPSRQWPTGASACSSIHSSPSNVATMVSGDRKGGLPFRQAGETGAPSSPPQLSAKSSLGRSKSNAETFKQTKHSLDQNLKQMFQKGGRFGGGTKLGSPEKAAMSKAKTAFGKSSSLFSNKKAAAALPPEARAVSAEFADFLNRRLERSAMADISLQLKNMIDKINTFVSKEQHQDIDDLSAGIQEFYQSFRRRLESKQQFHALAEDDVTKILDYAERYLTLSCHKSLFSPVMSNDEEKDLELQNRIRSFNWISTKDLHCTINESSQEVRDLLFEAINDILEMDGKMAPQDKMSCLGKCSKKIFEMLKISNETPASADDFLPCLIYVCLKANPPRIQSNINFVTRFCNENKLRMGEDGYFFANLCCAMSFIENMTAESVNMDPEEFESYVSGNAVPPGSWRTSLLMCEGLQQMSQNLKALSDLKTEHEQILNKAIKLHEEMADFQRDAEREVTEVLHKTQYEIVRKRKQPTAEGPNVVDQLEVDFDDDSAARELLPRPLTPQNMDAVDAAFNGINLSAESPSSKLGSLLEDYLCNNNNTSADNISLLSLDASQLNVPNISVRSKTKQDVVVGDGLDEHQISSTTTSRSTAYVGFTAQSCQIPNIPCDNTIVVVDTTAPFRPVSSTSLDSETALARGDSSTTKATETSEAASSIPLTPPAATSLPTSEGG